mmetsp:Transcript_45606/g.132145  ORF Transcript_45606/g.132145 Transcript_45606/m.132145 type:complete len:396 (+) Transcript_45606:123-1310(+)
MALVFATANEVATSGGKAAAPPSEDRKDLLIALRRQLEWYFSDANLSVDQLLHDQITRTLAGGGWLCCHWMKKVKRLLPFHISPELILEALKGSHVETRLDSKPRNKKSGNGADLRCLFLRRRQPLPPLLRTECRAIRGSAPPDPVKAVLRDPHGTLNRLQDRCRVQEQLNIKELGDSCTVFYERSQKANKGRKQILAVGYERVLYGDDGPYIEFNHNQVRWEGWPHFHSKKGYKNSYYDEYYTDASHALWRKRWQQWEPNATSGLAMLYAQTQPVNDRPWAPSAIWRPHARREQGYADYRPGFYYLSADGGIITTTQQGDKKPPAASKRSDAGRGRAHGGPRSPGRRERAGEAAASEDAPEQPGPPADEARWALCWDFKAGRCERGAHCKWRHA